MDQDKRERGVPLSFASSRAVMSYLLNVSPLVMALGALLLLVTLPPLVYLVQVSFYTTEFDGALGELTFHHYSDLVTNPRFLKNLINTIIYSIGSSAIAIVIGVITAWIVERTNTPFRKYVFVVSIVSLGTPHVLYTISWLLILGKSGPLNNLLRALFGGDGVYVDVYSMWGMVLVEGFTWGPMSFLLLSSVFRSSDSSFEEAAMMSGATMPQILRRVTIPLAAPAIFALVLLIFIRAFESFEIPALVGMPGRVEVLTTDIYAAVNLTLPADYGQAGAFSVVLLIAVALLLRAYNRMSKSAEKFQTITGKGFRPRVIDIGRWRYVTITILFLFLFILLICPVGIVLLASLQRFYETVNLKAFTDATLYNYIQVFRSGSFRSTIANSLILGVGSATLTCILTSLIAWLAVRRHPGASFLDQLATAPLVAPAIVMGIAFMQVFLRMPFSMYGSLVGLVIAITVQSLPYGMRYSYAGVMQVHHGLEEAAIMAGATARATFLRIVVPLIAPALISCWLFVFLVSVRGVSMAVLLAGPNSKVIAVTLFELWANGQTPELAAMGMTWMTFMTALSALFYIVARKYGVAAR